MPTSSQTHRLAERYRSIRQATEALVQPLSEEDQQLQSMVVTSPTKWHCAHATWFFEQFILQPAGVAPYNAQFGKLFNSYYEACGPRVARHRRGLLSRPTAGEVRAYRRAVDEAMLALLEGAASVPAGELAYLVELGLSHEQQHQELILTDILHAFSTNPMAPVYEAGEVHAAACAAPLRWQPFPGGLVEIGASPAGFSYDNEGPRHPVHLLPYLLASRLVTVGDMKAFIREGGYHTPSLWLSDGYEVARAEGWEAPLYAAYEGDLYRTFTLRGWRTPGDEEPVSHLSFWEATAIARFMDARLPTEAELENAAASAATDVGNFSDGPLVSLPAASSEGVSQLFGDVWEWTHSSYGPYPGYRPQSGALGEYNGKFMAQQFVLRGGSCFTPRTHMRVTYRNFWHPNTRFQMAGVRLARDVQ